MHADRLAARLMALSATPSRRNALRTLGGLGIAGVLDQFDVDARNKHKHKHKHKKNTQVTVCVNGQTYDVPKTTVSSLLSQAALLSGQTGPHRLWLRAALQWRRVCDATWLRCADHHR